MFNTSGMNRESPVGTGKTGLAREQPGLHREKPGRHRQSAGLLMYRSYTGTLSAFTRLAVALPGSVWARWSYGAVSVVSGAVPIVSSATPVVAGRSR
ncbi:hypothetical protein DPMN_117088 [Dreissena polymorpha]|uniref:Uncharacterized protein n=1 Tax=Dreissena polymorpha TaxID=45954 RepID=A0A9D4KQL7_DREPO|nr:hypothetical protein DPMN_117088 [Dreissena polymorpha]